MFLLRFLTCLACILFATQVRADSGAPDDRLTLHRAATGKDLAHNREWLTLGHYASHVLSLAKYRSSVQDETFFLAATGRTDPQAELLATVDAALDPYEGTAGQDPLCRYPARYHWLDRELGLSRYVRRHPDCRDYRDWRKLVDAHSVVLVYPAAHLNSPSSMYGHTLLRIDPATFPADKAFMLSWAVTFGANISGADNSIIYAYKGIFGGYPGAFSVLPYYDKLKEYSRLEHRDIWEYPLDFTPEEVDRLMQHLWELQGVNFGYYFFDENCSYRLLELLDVARPQVNFTAGYPTVVIPIDTVRGVMDTGAVTGATWRPSAATRLEYKIAQLTPEERQLARRLATDLSVRTSPAYTSAAPERRARMADVAYEYARYVQSGSYDVNQQAVETGYQLLQEISTLPKLAPPEMPTPFRPENGHDSSAVTVAAGREAGSNYVDAELKMSFHDLQDNIDGYAPGSSINMGRFVFRETEDGTARLQQLDIIDIHSYTARDEFFKPVSWQTSFGVERERTYGQDEAVEQVNGGGGVSYRVADGGLFYLLGMGRAEYNPGFANNLQPAAGVTSGMIWNTGKLTTWFGIEGYEFLNRYQRRSGFITANVALAKDLGLQFTASHHDNSGEEYNDVQLSLRWFFR